MSRAVCDDQDEKNQCDYVLVVKIWKEKWNERKRSESGLVNKMIKKRMSI